MLEKLIDFIPIITDKVKKDIEMNKCMRKGETKHLILRYNEWYMKWLFIATIGMYIVSSVVGGIFVAIIPVEDIMYSFIVIIAALAIIWIFLIFFVYKGILSRWGNANVDAIPEYLFAFRKIEKYSLFQTVWCGFIMFLCMDKDISLVDGFSDVFCTVSMNMVPMFIVLIKIIMNQSNYLFNYYVYDKNLELLTGSDNYITAQNGIKLILKDDREVKVNLLKDNIFFLDKKILVLNSHKYKMPQILRPSDYKKIQVTLKSGKTIQYVYVDIDNKWIELR